MALPYIEARDFYPELAEVGKAGSVALAMLVRDTAKTDKMQF